MAKTKKFKKLSPKENILSVVKANRKGSRDAQLENEKGFTSVSKVHKSKKAYSRKPKHKEIWG